MCLHRIHGFIDSRNFGRKLYLYVPGSSGCDFSGGGFIRDLFMGGFKWPPLKKLIKLGHLDGFQKLGSVDLKIGKVFMSF